MKKQQEPRPRLGIVLEALPSPIPPWVRFRRALKNLLRSYDLKCIGYLHPGAGDDYGLPLPAPEVDLDPTVNEPPSQGPSSPVFWPDGARSRLPEPSKLAFPFIRNPNTRPLGEL